MVSFFNVGKTVAPPKTVSAWTGHDLTVKIGDTTIIQDVNVTVPMGSILGLLGPNGAGKTTLLRTMCGTLKPFKGKVRLNDVNIARIPGKERAKIIAYVEQHQQTDLDLTVRQVVALGRLPHTKQWSTRVDDTADHIEEALETVSLKHLADRRWAGLSGGERQRVHLARALAQEPQLLGLDEPTNHLDLHNQIAFLSLIKELGLTTVVVVHDLDMAAAYCDEIVIMSQGRVVADGRTEEELNPDRVAEVFEVDTKTQKDERFRLLWKDTIKRQP